MPVADAGLARTLRLIAASIAIVVAVSLPLGYWLVVYSFAAEGASNDAEAHAELVTQKINASPDLWRFEIPRLDVIVATRLVHSGLPEKHYILDEHGAVLAQSPESLSPPIVTRSAPLLDSGTVVGQFVTSRSLVPRLRDTALVAVFGLILAVAVYISLSVLPLRALTRTLRSELRFRTLTEMSSDFYWESDAEHRLTQRASADKKLSAVTVFRQGAQIGQRRWEIPYLSPDEAGWQVHRAALDAHRPFRDFELSRLGLDGTERYISLSGDPVFKKSGAFTGYRGVGSDITARKRAEQAMRESAESLRLFADNVPAMTAVYDENLSVIFANKYYADFFGLGTADIIGKHLREIVGKEVYCEIEGHFARALQGHPVTYRRAGKLQNGEIQHHEIKLLPHIGEQGKVLGCFAVTTDITEHRLAEERIQRMAHHDSLTGLPNRLLFNDRLTQTMSLAKRDSRQFALLYLDLDKFKPVNDTLGHTAGDELLQTAAARIRSQVRESDTVARVGGDEFAVILPDIARRGEAETVARKIVAAVAAPFELGARKQRADIGTSIGIAIYPADASDADALVKAADAAMYGAKRAGSGFRFFAA